MPPRSKPFGAQVYRANLVVAGIRAAARALRGVASSGVFVKSGMMDEGDSP